ncbi:hypothetical protein LTR53_001404 [Teratosphaeriaceae sp. CCFEE 6253]|nr:hypothetical protein LTR53_001404 [Teratosphaeriaceae sp. CCFEE 6253]
MSALMTDFGHVGQSEMGGHGMSTAFGYPADAQGVHSQIGRHDNRDSILDQNEVHELDDFFDNPPGAVMAQRADNSFSAGMPTDLGMNYTYNHVPNGGMINPASTMSSTSPSYYQTHSYGQPMSAPPYLNGFQTPNHQHTSIDNAEMEDVAAASLMTLSSAQHSQQMSSFGAPSMAAWSALGDMQGVTNMAPGGGLPHVSRHSSSGSDMAYPVHTTPAALQRQQNYLEFQRTVQMTQAQAMQRSLAPVRAHSQGSDHGMYWPQGQLPQDLSANRPHVQAASGFNFGTDPLVTGVPHGYNSASSSNAHDGKAHNLMGVPGARQASEPDLAHAQAHFLNEQRRRAYQMQQGQNVARQFNSTLSSPRSGLPPTPSMLSPAQQQPGAQWGGLAIGLPFGGANGEESQQRKRRRLQADRDDDAEYRPERRRTVSQRGSRAPKQEDMSEDDNSQPFTPSNGTAAKRRKSAGRRTTSRSSPSSLADGTSPANASGSTGKRKSSAKSRQNLSNEEKRQNHILSEQKRRNVIRQAYHDIDLIVPILNDGKSGLSKAEQIKEIVAFLQSLMDGNGGMTAQVPEVPHNDDGQAGDDHDAACEDDDPAMQ